MLASLLKKVVGSKNDRVIKNLRKTVAQINLYENDMAKLSDVQLGGKTAEFKARLAEGATLDSLLPEAFAVVREAAKRTLKMRHYDVQLIGGMVLHSGKVAEMRTGEGKTLVATLALYLNALTGRGAHLVTVNDYLANRDANWKRPLFEFLGLTVGVIYNNMEREERKAAYQADITYGTNNEFGFDYLRDNMVFAKENRVQRGLNFALIDEVDSVLIDEARTPLIISGSSEQSSDLYHKMNVIIKKLSPSDYIIDEKSKQVHLNEAGHIKVEELLTKEGLLGKTSSLYEANNLQLLHYLYAALRANLLFKIDIDYIVQDGKVVIVDEHTGRTMPGRRWSDGLHQAVEAKEGVEIESENQTLASITFQNYFRLYKKLAGMTGTADTEAYELQQIYNLPVVVVPTHKPNQRQDLQDLIYMSKKEKFAAILQDIADCYERGQPVLVGTVSIETSEYVASLLKKHKIPHQVLNAKQHAREADIIADAGRLKAVTIATNMAGRGTDIVLGGKIATNVSEDEFAIWQINHDAVVKAGGLHVIGTERHESRRIDNQLRGRSGRQGDPGSTRFYLSLEDSLMRIFISDKISGLLSRLGLRDGESLTHPWVSKAVENAQRKVEGYNFDIRKQLLEFDDVANEQRKVIYNQRNELLEADDISSLIISLRSIVINKLVEEYIPATGIEEDWNISGLEQVLREEFALNFEVKAYIDSLEVFDLSALADKIINELIAEYQRKEQQVGKSVLISLEKNAMLSVMDEDWKEHLATMDYLRHSIHLRGYAQKDPKQEYKREAFVLFAAMLENIQRSVIAFISKAKILSNEEVNRLEQQLLAQDNRVLDYKHNEALAIGEEEAADNITYIRESAKIGRNDSCHCGSGKKFKNCHGQIT